MNGTRIAKANPNASPNGQRAEFVRPYCIKATQASATGT